MTIWSVPEPKSPAAAMRGAWSPTGMALTEARLAKPARRRTAQRSVSLDGFEREHNHIRGNSRSYDRALAALRMIVREPSLTYDVVTCVTGAWCRSSKRSATC